MPWHQSNAPSLAVVLPDELFAEILSWLAVKTLMRLRCVSKSWKTLISDLTFVKMHLERSARNPHLVLAPSYPEFSFVPLPISRLLEDPSTTVAYDVPACYQWNGNDCCCSVVGSCNGLLCIIRYSSFSDSFRDYWLYLWNPATRKRSGNLGSFRDFSKFWYGYFGFGYDSSTCTYKVVALRLVDHFEDHDNVALRGRSEVRVFSLGHLGDNSWRTIQSLPVVPLNKKYGAYLSDTINWLALRGDDNIGTEKLVIVSLDLSTEMCSELLLPRGFDRITGAHVVEQNIGALNGCLCFYHHFRGTSFVIWRMKEFGVHASWAQLLKITYQSLPIMGVDSLPLQWLPLCLSENGGTLILARFEDETILYNWRDNRLEKTRVFEKKRVEKTRITNRIWRCVAQNYVESLVLPH